MSLAAIAAFRTLSTANNYVYIYDRTPQFDRSIPSRLSSDSAGGFPVIVTRESASEEASHAFHTALLMNGAAPYFIAAFNK